MGCGHCPAMCARNAHYSSRPIRTLRGAHSSRSPFRAGFLEARASEGSFCYTKSPTFASFVDWSGVWDTIHQRKETGICPVSFLWWVMRGSNPRPRPRQGRALANWANHPLLHILGHFDYTLLAGKKQAYSHVVTSVSISSQPARNIDKRVQNM